MNKKEITNLKMRDFNPSSKLKGYQEFLWEKSQKQETILTPIITQMLKRMET